MDEQKEAAVIDNVLYRADADFVKSNSGFSIGGVAPIEHRVLPIVILDQHLGALGTIWAAAGTPTAVFCLNPQQLAELTHSTFEDISG